MPESCKKPKTLDMLWTQARGMYGNGCFHSIEELHTYAKKIFKDCPSLDKFRRRCAAEGWSKTLYRERQEIAQEKSYRQLFNEAGYGDVAMVNTIVAGCKHAEVVYESVMKKYRAIEDGSYVTQEALESIILELQTLNKSLGVSLDYIKEKNRLTGSYADGKPRSGSGDLADRIEDSIEELKAEYDRLKNQG